MGDLARIRFLTRNLEALKGLRDVVGGLCVVGIGILWGPDPYLGVPLPSAEDWAVPTSARLVAGAGVVVAGLVLYQRVKRFYVRRFGQVKQQAAGAEPAGSLSAATGLSYLAFVIGLVAGWRWLIALGALGQLIVYPLWWRQQGGVVPSAMVVLLLPALTLALPQHDPLNELWEAGFATFLVLWGTLGVVCGIVSHIMLVRLLTAGGRGTDD